MLSFTRSISHGLESLEADPTPIDAVIGDQSVLEIHGLDDVQLIAFRRLARILPHEARAVGEVGAGPVQFDGGVLRHHFVEEGGEMIPYQVASLQYARA